jgi:hypothetical protein
MTLLMGIGWYFVIGILVHFLVPKPPRAREAFEMAERLHPASPFLIMIVVALVWPIALLGAVRRWLW